jgi:hypothetical protein
MDTSNETTGDRAAADQAQRKAGHDTEEPKTAEALLELLRQGHDQHAHPNAMAVIEHAMNATRNYEQVRTALDGALDYIGRQVQRAKWDLTATGRTPNSLGVLQGNGVELDRLCGELARTREAAQAAQKLLATLGIDTDDDDRPGRGERMPEGSRGDGNLTV